jgi:hypothetical protein
MDRVDDGVWRTLARVYAVIVACSVCVPCSAVLPTLAGVDSLFVTLGFGAFGLVVAGGLVVLVDAQFDAAAVRLGVADPGEVSLASDPARGRK